MSTAPLENLVPVEHEVKRPPINIPQLTIMTGLQGMGKSTIAMNIAKLAKAVYISTDATRLQLGLSFETGSLYPEEQMQKVYDFMFDQADRALRMGKQVVLDGTFGASRRKRFSQLATSHTPDELCFVQVTVSDEEAHKQRMLLREAQAKQTGRIVATYETYLLTKDYYTPPAPSELVRVIHNDTPVPQVGNENYILSLLSPHFIEASQGLQTKPLREA